ncbi:amidohydrolase [Silanimonas sp.]|uniref:amidohydrolase n=1 Tax=Silanimonas sp. TaxID=1929290 RepID=UPI001BBF53EE|nr:amidohydrolase [Silanimonas sp.]MBS3896340.1 amidohydrolase [Silanimonas sp.]MBS3923653.1 amidohydrolase [Xanthomonadaceae bacterium]
MRPERDLRVALVQGDTRWHDPDGNRAYYGGLIAPLAGRSDLVVLPETFTSGFSNAALAGAEGMQGPTVAWIREQARSLDAAVCGSVQLRIDAVQAAEEGILPGVYNRLLFALPDGGLVHYDKRHLFRMAREHERYAAGDKRVFVDWRGWRIFLQVCYDLRFPVFIRNRFNHERAGGFDYDLALFVANWPAARAHAWKTLLRARAIENLACVIGVNRVGTDGNGIDYAGDSVALDPLGQPLVEGDAEVRVLEANFSAAQLHEHRERFPAQLDADAFELKA